MTIKALFDDVKNSYYIDIIIMCIYVAIHRTKINNSPLTNTCTYAWSWD